MFTAKLTEATSNAVKKVCTRIYAVGKPKVAPEGFDIKTRFDAMPTNYSNHELFRGDDVLPSVAFTQGFSSHGSALGLVPHMFNSSQSAYVSTSQNPLVSIGFASCAYYSKNIIIHKMSILSNKLSR